MSKAQSQRQGRAHRLIGTRRRAGSDGRKASRRRPESPSRVALIGRDVSQTPARTRVRCIAPMLAALLLSALFLVILRTEVLRLRYALGNAVAEEQRLSEQKRDLTVEMRRLRDPGRLARRARELGFERPEHVIRLDEDPFATDASRAGPPLEPHP